MVNTVVLMFFGRPLLRHAIKTFQNILKTIAIFQTVNLEILSVLSVYKRVSD